MKKTKTLVIVESPTKVPISSQFYFCYILVSEKTRKYYIGSTHNLKMRLREHNLQKSLSTKSNTPWKLIFYERFTSRAEAVKRERQIKNWKSRKAIERLIKLRNEIEDSRSRFEKSGSEPVLKYETI